MLNLHSKHAGETVGLLVLLVPNDHNVIAAFDGRNANPAALHKTHHALRKLLLQNLGEIGTVFEQGITFHFLILSNTFKSM